MDKLKLKKYDEPTNLIEMLLDSSGCDFIFDGKNEDKYVLVGVLGAGIFFFVDFVREVQGILATPDYEVNRIDRIEGMGFYSAKSYEKDQKVAFPKVEYVSGVDLKDKNVILLDVICDTGDTVRAVKKDLEERGVKSVHTFVLLARYRKAVDCVDAYGKIIEDDSFLVGYGLDYNGELRHLHYIYSVEKGETKDE